MITLVHNDLLVRQIGWTLLHTLWQGVAIALLLAIALRAMRGASSNARYIVACGAMTMLVGSAMVTFALPAEPPVAATPRLARLPQLAVPVAARSGVAATGPRATDVRPEDLVPGPYRVHPGDVLRVSIRDLVGPGVETVKQFRVNAAGAISLPLVGSVYVTGMTEDEIVKAIDDAYRRSNID